MQLREIITMTLLAGALPAAAACGPRVTIADDGSSDEDDGGPTTTSSTGGTSTWSTTSSTSTDTWTPTPTEPTHCEQTASDCDSCGDCALNGPCEVEMDTCVENVDCLNLIYCANDCGAGCGADPDPEVCSNACVHGPGGCMEILPGGTADYNAMVACVFQEQCPTLCGG